MKRLFIIGAGGHGKVVAEAAGLDGFEIAGFIDDTKKKEEFVTPEYKVAGSVAEASSIMQKTDYFVVAIGNNKVRKDIYTKMLPVAIPAVIIHPGASVSKSAVIGKGTVVLANAVINAECRVGDNCIINALSLLDHESVVGSHSHIAQGSIIGSNCSLPELSVTDIGQARKSFTKV